MRDIESLVPGFNAALQRLPGSSDAYGNLTRSLANGKLSMRNRAEINVLVATRIRCEYSAFVMSRLAERHGLTAEDVFFAGIGIAKGRRGAAILRLAHRMIAGSQLVDKVECSAADARMFSEAEYAEIVSEVALAVLTCSVLQSIAPKTPAGSKPTRREV